MQKSRRFINLIFSVGLLFLVLGFSYAFFIYNKTGLYTHTITGGKMNVIYSETTGNNITIANAYPLTDEEALTQSLEFEFTITGYNESEKNVYYAIEMQHDNDVDGKSRFLDSDMKLTLYENEEIVYKNEIFENLNEQDIHYGYIRYGTSESSLIVNNYKLKIWINDNVLITNTPDEIDTTEKHVYSTSDFANTYGNFKINVRADLTYDEVGYLTYDANGGEYTPEKTSLLTNKITLQKPVMENKAFLGWSSDPNALEPEYKSGEKYTGKGQLLYAVYGDTRNVMTDLTAFSSNLSNNITEIYFINDTEENIDTRYNASSIMADLTYNNQGRVLGWLEEDYLDEDGTQYYKLYIGSDGVTYFSTGYGLFNNYNGTKIDLANVDTSMVTDMSGMFYRCMKLLELDVSGFNTTKVTDMSFMFEYCRYVDELDVSNFDTSKVIDMSDMFANCGALTELDLSRFDTSNVTDMSYMFFMHGVIPTMTYLDLSSFDTSQVTNMTRMFYQFTTLNEVDLSNFDTSKVTDLSEMFRSSSVDNLDVVSNWQTTNVTNMYRMFYGCDVKKLDLSKWDTSQVTNMSEMFCYCRDLAYLDVSNFNTSLVTDMSGMFSECFNIANLDLSNFDTSQVTDMSNMFSGGIDKSLTMQLAILDISNFVINELTDTSMMFFNCSNLTTIYVNSDWNTGTITSSSSMFYGCTKLVGAISYDSTKVDITYANPDTGYFTRKMA